LSAGGNQVAHVPDDEEVPGIGGGEEVRDHPAVGARDEERVGALAEREAGEGVLACGADVPAEVHDSSDGFLHGRAFFLMIRAERPRKAGRARTERGSPFPGKIIRDSRSARWTSTRPAPSPGPRSSMRVSDAGVKEHGSSFKIPRQPKRPVWIR